MKTNDKTHFIYSLILLFLCFSSTYASDINTLKQYINTIISGEKAEVGVEVVINGKDSITVNNDVKYPLMSVFKLHQAVAVANKLSKDDIPLDTLLFIRGNELKEGTYSPLRDKYPDAERYMSVRELLRYTLLLSDNNACDILFNRIINTCDVDNYIRSLDISGFSISATEDDMHRDVGLCYANWSTPFAATLLMEKLLTADILKSEYRQFIVDTMMECQTGIKRLPAFTHNEDVRIGHKTGTGGKNPDGEIIAVNDMGFVILPDGQYYTIAVFIKDSREDMEVNENIIADISKAVYNYVNKIGKN